MATREVTFTVNTDISAQYSGPVLKVRKEGESSFTTVSGNKINVTPGETLEVQLYYTEHSVQHVLNIALDGINVVEGYGPDTVSLMLKNNKNYPKYTDALSNNGLVEENRTSIIEPAIPISEKVNWSFYVKLTKSGTSNDYTDLVRSFFLGVKLGDNSSSTSTLPKQFEAPVNSLTAITITTKGSSSGSTVIEGTTSNTIRLQFGNPTLLLGEE